MINITFIGNCQTISLCFFFQELLDSKLYNVSWVLYGDEFIPHMGKWSTKCENKIMSLDESIERIKHSDYIIYQQIIEDKSAFCNTNALREMKKNTCTLIHIPSIYLIYDDFDNSIKNLISRENTNNVDIKVSTIFYQFRNENLMLTSWHPSTFLFMEIMKILCHKLHVEFFNEKTYKNYLKNKNYIGLP